MSNDLNPYMPAYPVKPEFFAGRKDTIESLKESLRYTASARAINVAIVGEWGIGKTALLIKTQEIAKNEFNAVSIVVDAQTGQTSDNLLNLIIQKLLLEIRRVYPSIDLSTGSVREISSRRLDRVIAQSQEGGSNSAALFESDLVDIWGALPNQDRIVLIMVDNLEFLEKDELLRTVEVIRNVFQALPRSGCKIMIILSGKKIFYETTSQLYAPTSRFFKKLNLEAFTQDESLEAITLPIKNNKTFEIMKDAKIKLHDLSEGHPYILKSLCFHVFGAVDGKGKVTMKDIEKMMPELIDGLGTDLFDVAFDKASDEEKKVLHVIAESKKDILSFSEIQELANIPKKGPHLLRLEGKGLVTKIKRGKYSLFHPLFKEYLKHKQNLG